MRWLFVALMVCFAGFSGEAFATEDVRMRNVQTCIKQTRAPGSYAMSTFESLPVVVAADGGTEQGARDVNDCLSDKYQVQYGIDGVPWTDAVVQDDTAAQKCRTNRNVAIAVGLVLGAGAVAATGGEYAVAGALLGGGIGAAAADSKYKACMAAAGGPKRSGEIYLACNGGGGVMHSGDGYCLN